MENEDSFLKVLTDYSPRNLYIPITNQGYLEAEAFFTSDQMCWMLLKMKKQFKVFFRYFTDKDFLAFLTNTLGYGLFAASGLVYSSELLRHDNAKLTAVGITAFGVCAVLSNISYRAAPLFDEENKRILI